jgi:hypothetical protein
MFSSKEENLFIIFLISISFMEELDIGLKRMNEEFELKCDMSHF